MTNEEVLKQEFNLLRIELVSKYDELGMRASGKWEDNLKVNVSGLIGILTGLKYSDQLEVGRGKTTGGGDGSVLKAIEKWIDDKGIKPLDDKISISSLAYLIARKIHQEGYDRKEHGGLELISSVITPERIQKIIDRVTEFNVSSFVSEVKGMFNGLEKV